MKASIVYHSESGNTEKLAAIIAEGISGESNIEVRRMGIDSLDEEFITDSKLVILGCPTYAGSVSWQMKRFTDTVKLKLAGKLGGVFVTENFVGGGADLAELLLIGTMLVRGMVVYSAGTSDGQPFTHYGAVAIKDGDDAQQQRAKLFGARMARKALELFGT